MVQSAGHFLTSFTHVSQKEACKCDSTSCSRSRSNFQVMIIYLIRGSREKPDCRSHHITTVLSAIQLSAA